VIHFNDPDVYTRELGADGTDRNKRKKRETKYYADIKIVDNKYDFFYCMWSPFATRRFQ